MYDEFGNWIGDGGDGGDGTTTADTNWSWNEDGSITNLDTGEIFDNGSLIGYENADGTWTDLNGITYDSSNNPIGDGTDFQPWDTGFDQYGNFATYLGDGVFEVIDQDGNRLIGSYNESGEFVANSINGEAPTGPVSSSVLSSVANKLGELFRGGQVSSGSGGGMNFGGGSQSGQQRAQQQLAAAQQAGAPAAVIAALQRQLQALQAGGSSGSGSGNAQIAVAIIGALALFLANR